MLNILSLQALRKKSTGPSKVAKNLIKGLDLIGEKYIINGDIHTYKNIYILDDEKAFRTLDKFPKDCEIVAGPILHWKKNIPDEIGERYRFLYPSQWIKNLGDKYKWHKHSSLRPVGIDTYTYVPPKKEKSSVLIYFKTRFPAELAYCEKLLQEKSIAYNIINYDTGYQESDFLSLLEISKYVIRIGRQETQGIALEEVLSMNVPILLRDVHTVGQWEPHTEYEKKGYEGGEWEEKATAAEYFDTTCGIRFWEQKELEQNIEAMEKEYLTFTPRQYIISTLSLEKQAEKMISFFSQPHRGDTIKKKKYGKNNTLLKFGFLLLDNQYFKKLYHIVVNFYQKRHKIMSK